MLQQNMVFQQEVLQFENKSFAKVMCERSLSEFWGRSWSKLISVGLSQ